MYKDSRMRKSVTLLDESRILNWSIVIELLHLSIWFNISECAGVDKLLPVRALLPSCSATLI